MLGTLWITPTAKHVMASGQETSISLSVFAGGVWEFQVDPSNVISIFAPPTAVHSMMVKQEMD
jgi:hypothetical protein